jgi:hypothetical protein
MLGFFRLNIRTMKTRRQLVSIKEHLNGSAAFWNLDHGAIRRSGFCIARLAKFTELNPVADPKVCLAGH